MEDQPSIGDMDITNSPGFGILEELVQDGSLTKAQSEQWRNKLQQLHEWVMQSYEKEKELLKDAKKFNQELLGEKIKLEKQSIRKAEDSQVNQNLDKEKEKAMKELEECNERDSFLTFESQELVRELSELQRQLDGMQQENDNLVLPELKKAQDEITELQDELGRKVAATKVETTRKEEYQARTEVLKKQRLEIEEDKVSQRQTLQKIKADPERIKKNADVVEKAKENLAGDVKRLAQRVEDCDAELMHQAKKRKEADDVGKDLGRKLDLHRETIEQRERDVESVKKNLELEKAHNHDQLNRRADLEKAQKHADDDLRREFEKLAMMKSDFEKQKKTLKKKKQIVDSTLSGIPQLRLQLTDAGHQLEAYRTENAHLQGNLGELKQEVDIFIAKFLRQEGIEKTKKEELLGLVGLIKQAESDISQWSSEEHKQNKTVAMLSAQREIKAREASKAIQNERETKEDLKMKELIILDLTKKK